MGKTEDRVRITVSNCMKSKWLWLLLLQWTTTCFASQIQEQWHGFPPSWNPRRGLIFLSLVALLLLLLLRLKLIYRRLSLVSTWASPSSPEDGYFSRFFFIIIISLFSFSFSFSLNFCSIVVLLGYGCVEFWYILGSVWQNWCSATCLAEILITFWWLGACSCCDFDMVCKCSFNLWPACEDTWNRLIDFFLWQIYLNSYLRKSC